MISFAKRSSLALLTACFIGEGVASAMAYESARLSVYRRGEALFGDEFLALNEQIVDYLATLRRPTGPLERIVYDCNVKSRSIEPSVIRIGGTDPGGSSYVPVTMVYDIKDCVEHLEP